MKLVILFAAICALLTACSKEESPTAREKASDEALRKFIAGAGTKPKKIETFEEYEARRKAEAQKK